MFIYGLFYAGLAWGRDWGCAFAHAPLQEFGDMLIKSIRTRIKIFQGKRICASWWIPLLVCVCAHVPVSFCVHKRMCVTDLRA